MSDVVKLCVVCSKVFRSDRTTCPDDGTVLVVEASEAALAPRAGHVLGNYRLLRTLGEGGVGTVFEAEHVRLGRKMAIKVLHRDVVSKEMVTRFFNEARAVNEIRHPNIIEVEDFITTPTGEHYMLMELLQGEDLRTAISREGNLDPERVAAIGEQVASALAAVHRVKIIHRDLKPDNVFLVKRDGREVAKLLDFGVAKFTEDEQGVTRAGMTMGTPAYMAPEMIISGKEKEVGPGADIYALGMVMYEALTGGPAFNSSSTATLLRAQCFEPVVPPSTRRGAPISPVIEAAVMKCLEKAREHRFLDADELSTALRSQKPVKLSAQIPVPQSAIVAATRASHRRTILLLPAFAMAAGALVLQLLPRSDDGGPSAKPVQAATLPTVAPTPAPAPAPSPAPSPTPAPPHPSTVLLALASQPDGAELFIGADRKPLGKAPVTTEIPMSSELIALVARFPDGSEVSESIVPDRPLPELVFKKPLPVVAAPKRPAVKRPANPATAVPQPNQVEDRDGTLDPFK